MIWEFYALNFFVGLFESFIFFKLMKYRTPLKNPKWEWPSIVLVACLIFTKSILGEMGISQELLIVGLIFMTIGVGHLFFKGSIKVKIATVLTFHIIMVATEIMAIAPILQLPGMTLNRILEWGNVRLIGATASKLLAYMVVTAIGRFGKKSRVHAVTGDLLLEGLALMLLVVGMSLIIYPFVTVNEFLLEYEKKWPFVLGLSFMIIAFTSVWVYEKLFERSQKSYWLRLENELLSEQTKYYGKIDEMIKHYQGLQHDVNKHMAMVNHYIERESYEDLKTYAAQWKQSSLPDKNIVITQSQALSGLLTHYNGVAVLKGLSLCIDTKLHEPLTFPEIDLSIVVGNVLENAFQAASKLEGASIDVKLETNGAYFLLICKNPHKEILRKKGDLYVSTKREGRQTGLGLMNVSRIVDKYEGQLKIESDSENFKVTLMMLIPKELYNS